jgi:DNA topoisomerase-1
MVKRLLIVESPGKVKKLSQILGRDWIVRASCGHIRELSNEGEDSLGFVMDEDKIECLYIPRSEQAENTIQQLKAAVKQVSEVVLATDPDREGETIAWHLKEVLKLKNPARVTYTEITESAVNAAIANPRQIDSNLVDAGLCRDCLDKLVGYKGSPLLWQLNNGAKSVGRVQSATLHIACDREREIQNFKAVDYWNVWVDYTEGFRAFYKGKATEYIDATAEPEQEVHDDAESLDKKSSIESARILSEAEALEILSVAQNSAHKIINSEGKLTSQQPPPPLITSTLQQVAGSKLKFSPEKTMQVAQKLYEAGLITYMRTDSVMLSPEFVDSGRKWLEENDPENLSQKVTKHRSGKTAQEAHEAIRPTDINHITTQPVSDEDKLYDLIWRRALASQCCPAQLRKTILIVQSENLLWQAKGQTVDFLGYAKYWSNLSKDALLPNLNQGSNLKVEKSGHEKKQTQPPTRYSEPKLVQQMERKGIGRPSTYSSTIATLKKRGYVELLKESLQPTKLGLEVDAFLMKVLPELVAADFTAQMELSLDAIARGEKSWQKFLTSWNREYFVPALAKAKGTLLASSSRPNREYEFSKTPCPQCNNPLAKIKSEKVSKKYFLKCVGDCENIVLFWSERAKVWEAPRQNKGDEKPAAKITTHNCPVCKSFLEEHSYIKDGQEKVLLRCSNSKSRNDPKHKDVVFFNTASGYWSPKLGNLPSPPKQIG